MMITLLKHFSMCLNATRGETAMPHVTQKMFSSASSSTSVVCQTRHSRY